MKKTIQKLKLQLKAEKIRELASADHGRVAGGFPRTFTPYSGCNTISQVDDSCCGC